MARGSGYQPIPQARFSGGLNLVDGVDVVSAEQAIDIMNVVFLPQGGMRQRDGWRNLTSSGLPNSYIDSIAAYYKSDGTRHLIVSNGSRLDALDTNGTSIANVATSTSPHSFARFGAPGSEHLYIANGVDTVRRWTGGAFDTPAYTGSTPAGRYLAVQATDNRLVVAKLPGFPDRVAFSEPGLPHNFPVNNIIDLRPGSGEAITGAIAWREYVFVFKESEFFIFYGNSADSTGKPIFNYRPVSGAGSIGPVTAAPEGVYFMDRRGVWLTNGGEAKLVSRMVDPIFSGGASIYYNGGIFAHAQITNPRMHYHQGRLYVAYPTAAGNDRVLVFAPEYGWWTLYDFVATAMTSFRVDTRDELVFGTSSGFVGRYFEGSGYARDSISSSGAQGSAIVSRWRQGWVDYNNHDQKSIRQTKLWGSGRMEIGVARDFEVQPPKLTAVEFSGGAGLDTWGSGGAGDVWGNGSAGHVWGPSTVPQSWLVSHSVSGHLLSLLVQNNAVDKTWTLHRLEHGFRPGRSTEVLGRRSR